MNEVDPLVGAQFEDRLPLYARFYPDNTRHEIAIRNELTRLAGVLGVEVEFVGVGVDTFKGTDPEYTLNPDMYTDDVVGGQPVQVITELDLQNFSKTVNDGKKGLGTRVWHTLNRALYYIGQNKAYDEESTEYIRSALITDDKNRFLGIDVHKLRELVDPKTKIEYLYYFGPKSEHLLKQYVNALYDEEIYPIKQD